MVRMESIRAQLKRLVEPFLDTRGFELVDVAVKGEGYNRLHRVADKPGAW